MVGETVTVDVVVGVGVLVPVGVCVAVEVWVGLGVGVDVLAGVLELVGLTVTGTWDGSVVAGRTDPTEGEQPKIKPSSTLSMKNLFLMYEI
jgi:hypothetical protein